MSNDDGDLTVFLREFYGLTLTGLYYERNNKSLKKGSGMLVLLSIYTAFIDRSLRLKFGLCDSGLLVRVSDDFTNIAPIGTKEDGMFSRFSANTARSIGAFLRASLKIPGNHAELPVVDLDYCLNQIEQGIKVAYVEKKDGYYTLSMPQFYSFIWNTDDEASMSNLLENQFLKQDIKNEIAYQKRADDSANEIDTDLPCIIGVNKLKVADDAGFEKEELSYDLLRELTIHAMVETLYASKQQTSLNSIDVDAFPKVTVNSLISALSNMRVFRTEFAVVFNTVESRVVYPRSVLEIQDHFKTLVDVNSRKYESKSGEEVTIFEHLASFVRNIKFSSDVLRVISAAAESEASFNKALVQTLVYALVDSKELRVLDSFRKSNPIVNFGVQQIRNKLSMRNLLTKVLVGQPKAVNQVLQSWFSSGGGGDVGPRMILTLAGVSGVGKSHLARSFTNAINETENANYVFKEFSMSQFTDEKLSNQLFGAGNVYTNASLGGLTAPVRGNPKHIILFDEIEKAHPSIITSLLGLLDTGYETDMASLEVVDFSQSIIIFTTNVGQDVISQNAGNKEFNVFDVLRSSNRANGEPYLVPELINRLAKGAAVIFDELAIHDLTEVVRRQLESFSSIVPGLRCQWPDHFEYAVLKICSPEFKVRRISNQIKEITSQIIVNSADHLDEIELNQEIKVFVDDKTHNPAINGICGVVSDRYEFTSNPPEFQKYDLKLQSYKTVESLAQDFLKTPFKVTFIDILSLGNTPVHRLRALCELAELNSTMAIYTFCGSSEVSEGELYDIRTLSNHREHFNVDFNEQATIDSAFYSAVHAYSLEEDIQGMMRRSKILNFNSQWAEYNGSEGIKLSFNSMTNAISSQDLSNVHLQRSVPNETLKDVFGLARAKQRLSDVIEFMKHPEAFTAKGTSPPTGYLLAGDPGTGKTLLARALAGECQLPFFSISSSDLLSDPSVSAATAIRKLFQDAKKYAPSIIFIDEIESIALSREKGGNLTVVNTLLTAMDGFEKSALPVFVLAATNYPEALDKAVVRPGRFDEVIHCDFPNLEARFQLLKHLFRNDSVTEVVLRDIAVESTRLSPAQLDQLFRETSYINRIKGVEIDLQLLRSKLTDIRYGSPSESTMLSKDAKLETAYHEAGHLFAIRLLQPEMKLDYITIEPRDSSLGFVSFNSASEEISTLSKERIHKKVVGMLAGRAAEYLLHKNWDMVSTGATSDIRKATTLVKLAVFDAGLWGEYLPVNIDDLSDKLQGEYKAKAEQAVLIWLKEAQDEAIELLEKYWMSLSDFALKLNDRESFSASEIAEFFNEYEI